MNNLAMLGVYTGTTTAGIQSYNPTKTNSFWIEIASNAKSISPGFFFGTSKNNGTNTPATALSSIYMRELNESRVV